MNGVLADGIGLRASLPGCVARGEIHAVFQPQFDLATDRIVGAEALCRWRSPLHGDVPAATFIALAETMGVIDEIGQHMAETSLAALDDWISQGTPIDVSVNVSPKQLHNSVFTDWLALALSHAELRGSRLTLEITESEPIDNVTDVAERLDRLQTLGLGVAVDDFGAGHATLGRLRELHGTELKLDRSLIEDPRDEMTAFLRDVVDHAHANGIRVVAEGIETSEQLERVTSVGCDRAQGYLLGRPMSKDALTQLLG